MTRMTRLSLSSLTRALLPAVGVASLLWLTAARAEAQTGDPYPTNTIAFFNAGYCPMGWSAYADGSGRTIVPVTVADGVGQKVLNPLPGGANLTHAHAFSSSIGVKTVSYVGLAGGGNTNLAKAGKKEFSGTTDVSDLNVPYVQLMICIKVEESYGMGPPSGVTAFFRDISCPTGWANIPKTNERFLVGLPQNGSVQAEFGGRPLQPQENREHQHEFSGSMKTNAAGIAGNSGCCAKGYARNGTYQYNKETASGASRSTSPAKADLPYIQLMQCRKQ
jgi:hypothetical protein